MDASNSPSMPLETDEWLRGGAAWRFLFRRLSGPASVERVRVVMLPISTALATRRTSVNEFGRKIELPGWFGACTLAAAFGGEVAEWFKAHAWKA